MNVLLDHVSKCVPILLVPLSVDVTQDTDSQLIITDNALVCSFSLARDIFPINY